MILKQDLFKSIGDIDQFLKPKILFKTAPDHMKKESGDFYLHNKDIFSLDDVDGALVGGASLKAVELIEIAKYAQP